MSKVLIVMSAASVWERTDGSVYPTGYWAEEVAAPHEKFVRGDVLNARAFRQVLLRTRPGKVPRGRNLGADAICSASISECAPLASTCAAKPP